VSAIKTVLAKIAEQDRRASLAARFNKLSTDEMEEVLKIEKPE